MYGVQQSDHFTPSSNQKKIQKIEKKSRAFLSQPESGRLCRFQARRIGEEEGLRVSRITDTWVYVPRPSLVVLRAAGSMCWLTTSTSDHHVCIVAWERVQESVLRLTHSAFSSTPLFSSWSFESSS